MTAAEFREWLRQQRFHSPVAQAFDALVSEGALTVDEAARLMAQHLLERNAELTRIATDAISRTPPPLLILKASS